MKQYKYFFIAYVIAILSGTGAYAATNISGLATTNYVDTAIDAKIADKADKAATLAGYGIDDAYTKTQTNDAITTKINTLDATNNVAAGNYITAVNEADGKVSVTTAKMDTTPTADSTAPVTSGGVKAALDGKLSTTGTAARATADASGNNIVNVYATKAEVNSGLAGKQATLTTGDTGNIKGMGSVTVTKDANTGVITVNGTDTKYTLPAATNTVRGGVIVDTALSASSENPVQNKAVNSALNGKQDKTSIVVPTASGDIAAADVNSETKYPSMKAAGKIAANAVAQVVVDLGELQTEVTELSGTVNNNKTAAENAIKGLTGTVTGTTGVVKTISQTNGKITATRDLVATADLASDAVTNAKLADNAVQSENIKDGEVKTSDLADGAVTVAKTTGIFGYIPSGGADATTTAQIWVQ